MARIKSKTLKWKPPADADVVKYRIYVTYGDSAEPYTGTMVEVTETHAVLPDIFPEGTFSQEGNYIIQVTAIKAMKAMRGRLSTLSIFSRLLQSAALL